MDRIAASIGAIRKLLDECERANNQRRGESDWETDNRLGIYADPEAAATGLMERAFLACITLCQSAGFQPLLEMVSGDYAEAKKKGFLKQAAWEEGVYLVWSERIARYVDSIESGLGVSAGLSGSGTGDGQIGDSEKPCPNADLTAEDASLPKRARVAYSQYRRAALALAGDGEREPTDQQCHQWLMTHNDNEELPALETWQRYVREARKLLGEQKNAPRAQRGHGRSIVSAGDVEPSALDETD